MQLHRRFLAICSALILVYPIGCAHTEFTHSAVSKVRVGMTEQEITELFGQPDRRQVMTCGSETSAPWQCLIYTYELSSTDWNSFVFNTERHPPLLNHYDIEKVYADFVGPETSK